MIVILKVVLFEQNSDKIFPRLDIKGGLAITLRDSDKNFGELITFTAFNELNSILKKVEQSKNFQSIANIAHSYSTYKLTEKLHNDFPDAEQMLSKGHKWDVVSNIFDSLGNVFYDIKPNDDFEYVQIIGRSNNNRTYKWIRKEYIKDDETLMTYNVLLPKANGSGALGEVVSTPLVGTPLVGWTQTFMGFGTFNNRLEADNALKYFKSKFARTMLGVLKITQDNPISTWAKVPLQDFTTNSDIDWTKSVAEIDQQLYMKYGLDDTEIQFIETHVKEMV